MVLLPPRPWEKITTGNFSALSRMGACHSTGTYTSPKEGRGRTVNRVEFAEERLFTGVTKSCPALVEVPCVFL